MAIFEFDPWTKDSLYGYNGKDEIVKIPKKAKGIYRFSHAGCKTVKRVEIPDSVENISTEAFVDCPKLETFVVAASNTHLSTDGRSLINEKGELIAYANASGTSYVVPGGVTSIERSAFAKCTSLEEIVIPEGVTKICENAFEGCKSLTKVSLPNGMIEIGLGAFKNCTSLVLVNVPYTVRSISPKTFENCRSLAPIRVDCPSISCWLEYRPSIPERYDLYIDGKILTDLIVPDDIPSLPEQSFANCASLETVVIPETVESIGATRFRTHPVFSNCPNIRHMEVHTKGFGQWRASANAEALPKGYDLYVAGKKFDKLIISEGTTEIERYLYEGLTSLNRLDIPASLSKLDIRSIAGSHIEEINIAEGNPTYLLKDGVLCTHGGDIAFYPPTRKGDCFTVTADTKRIGYWAFTDCVNLERIVIESPDTKIDGNAFHSKMPLLVELPADTQVFPDGGSFCGNVAVKCSNAKMVVPDIAAGCFSGKAVLLSGVSISDIPTALKIPAAIGYMMMVSSGDEILDEIHAGYKKYITSQRKNLYPEIFSTPAVAEYMINESIIDIKDIDLLELMAEAYARPDLASVLDEYAAQPKKKAVAKAAPSVKKVVEKPQIEPIVAEALQKKKIDSKVAKAVKVGVKLSEKEELCSPEAVQLIICGCSSPQGVACTQPRKKADFALVRVDPIIKDVVALLDKDALVSYLENLYSTVGLRAALPALCVLATGDALVRMKELAESSSGWANSDRQDIRIARGALMYNDSDEIMALAEKLGILGEYARIRHTTADKLRDTKLSDFGFTKAGERIFSLGGKAVTARLTSDLKVELYDNQTEKVIKSIPKKDADPALYEQAKSELAKLKKDIREVVKQRKQLLLDDFLSGRERKVAEWEKAYLDNPVLAGVARLIVWQQGNTTFTVCDGKLIGSDGKEYMLAKAGIKVAHPIEMSSADVGAWRKYFAKNALKQPFAQIWERAIPEGSVKSDRYQGFKIPYYRFRGREKHGITVYDNDFHDDIEIVFTDCASVIERLDWERHYIDNNHCFEIKSFEVLKHTRMANHVVTYLDRVCTYPRVVSGDMTLIEEARDFTLEQLIDYINIATDAGAVELAAAFMEVRDEQFSEYSDVDLLLLD